MNALKSFALRHRVTISAFADLGFALAVAPLALMLLGGCQTDPSDPHGPPATAERFVVHAIELTDGTRYETPREIPAEIWIDNEDAMWLGIPRDTTGTR